ncbi:MAG: RsmE family RNA methyltransferase [Candidatus Paceibacterota bacterium]|jgi:16S rRNA (uracil1498-N3)-methyltransferase
MKIHRFLITDDLSPQSDLILRNAGMIRQIKTVLRLREGGVIALFNDRGQEAHARIVRLSGDQVMCRVDEVSRRSADAPIAVTVYCAILKRENFEWVAQKITEIGAHALVPCVTERTIKKNIIPARVATIMREAAEQSGRVTMPLLLETMRFVDAFDGAMTAHEPCVLFDPRGLTLDNSPCLAASHRAVNIFIGPEGGWSDEEYEYARARGACIISLGGTVLRAETAAVVGTYAIVWRAREQNA